MTSRRTGFPLVELLVAAAMVATLTVILFPVFARGRAHPQQTQCVANLKRLTRGLLMYASDWGQKLPSTSDCTQPLGKDWRYADPFGNWIPQDPRHWCWKILPYVRSRALFRCPAVVTSSYPDLTPPGVTPDYLSYSMNGVLSNHNGEGGLSLEALPHPADIVALQECGQAATGCNNESTKWDHMRFYSYGWALSWSSLPMQPPHPWAPTTASRMATQGSSPTVRSGRRSGA